MHKERQGLLLGLCLLSAREQDSRSPASQSPGSSYSSWSSEKDLVQVVGLMWPVTPPVSESLLEVPHKGI